MIIRLPLRNSEHPSPPQQPARLFLLCVCVCGQFYFLQTRLAFARLYVCVCLCVCVCVYLCICVCMPGSPVPPYIYIYIYIHTYIHTYIHGLAYPDRPFFGRPTLLWLTVSSPYTQRAPDSDCLPFGLTRLVVCGVVRVVSCVVWWCSCCVFGVCDLFLFLQTRLALARLHTALRTLIVRFRVNPNSLGLRVRVT